jgi:MoaA/NifB/PqqE/SkfB family radical SAM enzyme
MPPGTARLVNNVTIYFSFAYWFSMSDGDMDPIDAWLHWNITENCNLHCAYCITGHSVETPAREVPEDEIDIAATIKTLNNSNRTFLIGLTGGGEPFLAKNFLELSTEITQNHYLLLTTNLISPKVKKFAERIDPAKVTCLVASLHIKELERIGLVERYIEHFLFCKEKGFNIVAQEVGHPGLLPEVERYKEFFKNRGISITFNPFIGEYNGKIYPGAYAMEEIKLFGFTDDVLNRNHKGKACNAGYNVGVVDCGTGNIHPCYSLLDEQIGNIYKEIHFNNHLLFCPFESCDCPFYAYYPGLLEKALKQQLPQPIHSSEAVKTKHWWEIWK